MQRRLIPLAIAVGASLAVAAPLALAQGKPDVKIAEFHAMVLQSVVNLQLPGECA